jgi:hypothetical protein
LREERANWDVTATGKVARLNGMGYDVHAISSWEGIVAFARAFSRKHYEEALRAK